MTVRKVVGKRATEESSRKERGRERIRNVKIRGRDKRVCVRRSGIEESQARNRGERLREGGEGRRTRKEKRLIGKERN